jgi:amidase
MNVPAMSWSEWMAHDGVSLAGLVRSGQLTAAEVVSQAAEAVGQVDGRLCATLETFEDVVADPTTDHPNPAGRLFGVPIFLKDLGSRMGGRLQESGSGLLRGYRSAGGELPPGRFDTGRALDDPRIRNDFRHFH